MMSQYEDALDESDNELRKLCHDAARHLNRTELRRQKPTQVQPVVVSPSYNQHNNNNATNSNNGRSKRNNVQQTSSSENSSVEKITNDAAFRSRQGTSTVGHRRRRKVNGSAGGAGSSDSNENGDDWRHVSYALQEAAYYPILYQLNQQLQILTSQLYEMEATNVLQLKLIYRVMKIALKTRRRTWATSSTGITFFGWIFLFSWPVILQILYNFYKRYYWM